MTGSFHVLHLQATADPWWFAAAVLGELGAYAGYILAYRDFARVKGRPDLG